MSFSSEMEKNLTEDERADPGTESAGQATSPVSSTSNLLQDPFLVSVHIITDPGKAKTLQSAADRLLSLLHPQLTLFRVSERAERPKPRPQRLTDLHLSLRPCLSVILFLQEDYGREERHEWQLRHPPWHYHHTEQIKGSSFSPVMQDFFILAPGTPLWALRQVHYGKKIVRFTIYCRYETYSDQVRLYRLLLRRPLAQMNQLYGFCVIYSNHHMEIQLSFKRLAQGQNPTHTECTIMEIRVRNMGELIPLLPHPCRPISDIRWQTKDYDGNKILLQAQNSSQQSRDTIPSFSPPETPSVSLSNSYGLNAHQNCPCQSTSNPCTQNPLMQSKTPLPPQCKQDDKESVQGSQEIVRAGWTDLHTRSVFSMATEAFHSVSTYSSTPHPCSSFSLTMPRFRINVDTLVGAKETDVDTGLAVISRSVDLSVVSAYLFPRTQIKSNVKNPQPLSEPPQLFSIASSLNSTNKTALLSKSVCSLPANSNWNRGEHQSNGSDISQDSTEEKKQEFFI